MEWRSQVLCFTGDFSATLRFGRNGLTYLLFVINVKYIPSRPNTVSGEISGLAIYWRFLRYASLRSKWIGIFHPLALYPLRTLATSSLSSADSPLAYLAREGLYLENYRFVLSELLRLLRLVLRIRLWLISQMKNPLDFPPCSSGLLMIRMSIYNSKCSVDLLY